MDVEVIQGTKKGSRVFYVTSENKLYVRHDSKNEVTYVWCHEKNCGAKGKICDGQFSYTTQSVHSNHSATSTSATIAYFNFFNELKEQAKLADKEPKACFEDLLTKYDFFNQGWKSILHAKNDNFHMLVFLSTAHKIKF
jgi:hypothetical protein